MPLKNELGDMNRVEKRGLVAAVATAILRLAGRLQSVLRRVFPGITPLTQWPEACYPTAPQTLPDIARQPDLAILRKLCWAAQLAYEVGDSPRETDKLARILRRWNWTTRHVFLPVDGSRRGVRGYIAETATATVIAFSGTEPTNLTDWATDLDFAPGDDPGIHGGFADAAALIWDDILSAMRPSDSAGGNAAAGAPAPGRPLFLIGHSLGAAIAAITAFHLVESGLVDITRLQAVTFGMPRTGLADFAAAYRGCGLAARTWRLTQGADLVPLVPPYRIGFRHVGNLLACPHLGSFDLATLVADRPEPVPALADLDSIKNFLRSLPLSIDTPPFPGSRLAVLLPRQFRDHLTDCYLRALGERIGGERIGGEPSGGG